jgi:acyl carrier protein
MRGLAIRPRVVRAMADELGLDPDDLQDGVTLADDLGLDGVERLLVVCAVEAATGVALAESEVDALVTVGELVALASARCDAGTRASAAAWPRVWARLVPGDARSVVEHVGPLTPYLAEVVVDAARRAAAPARLDAVVAADAGPDGLAAATRALARARGYGVEVSVRSGDGLPPIADTATLARERERLRRLATLATLASDLLHELQHERDLSALHAASHQRKLAVELAAQASRTDTAVGALNGFVAVHADELDDGLRARLADAEAALVGLRELRAAVAAPDAAVAAVVDRYLHVGHALLAATEAIAAVTPDAEWGRLAKAHLALLRAKETASLERSQLATAIELTGGLAAGQELALSALIAAEHSFLDLFAATARPEAVSAWKRTAAGSSFREAAQLQRLALQRPGLPLDAERVFNVMAGKLDRLRELEAVQLEGLMNRAAAAAAAVH